MDFVTRVAAQACEGGASARFVAADSGDRVLAVPADWLGQDQLGFARWQHMGHKIVRIL
jgi:hypothetical protein